MGAASTDRTAYIAAEENGRGYAILRAFMNQALNER
jgi:hypothetical protein